MMNCSMYWGGVFDQAQGYVNIQGVYTFLKDSMLSPEEAKAQLENVRDTQLLPWFEEDVLKLEWAYTESALVLSGVV